MVPFSLFTLLYFCLWSRKMFAWGFLWASQAPSHLFVSATASVKSSLTSLSNGTPLSHKCFDSNPFLLSISLPHFPPLTTFMIFCLNESQSAIMDASKSQHICLSLLTLNDDGLADIQNIPRRFDLMIYGTFVVNLYLLPQGVWSLQSFFPSK